MQNEFLIKNCKLVPIEHDHQREGSKKYIEQIIMMLDEYPSALVHIDTFYSKIDCWLYELLDAGETVECELGIYFEDDPGSEE